MSDINKSSIAGRSLMKLGSLRSGYNIYIRNERGRFGTVGSRRRGIHPTQRLL